MKNATMETATEKSPWIRKSQRHPSRPFLPSRYSKIGAAIRPENAEAKVFPE